VKRRKPGQLRAGSGTAPTLLGRRYLAFADNADPLAVHVLRRREGRRRREVCAVRLFPRGASAMEASLVAAGRSLFAANGHGYTDPLTVEGGRTTTGGLARVDLLRRARGCRVRWRSREVSPSGQPVLSRVTGLLYTMVKPAGVPDGWYLGALDPRTGQTVFRALAGEGLGHNPNHAGITLGPTGSAYVGTLGGVIALADTPR
jgi:hypothetical protein